VRSLTQRLLLVALASLLLSTAADAQRKQMLLGPQVGFATANYLDFFLGAQFSYPVAPQFDIYPSFDLYFPGNNVTAWALNGDVRYWPKLNMPDAGLYVGAGLNYTHFSVDFGPFGSGTFNEVGLGLLGGWDFKAVSWRPFAQLRIVIGDADRVEFGGGVNFKL
jgi:hypothetical protein